MMKGCHVNGIPSTKTKREKVDKEALPQKQKEKKKNKRINNRREKYLQQKEESPYRDVKQPSDPYISSTKAR